MAKIEVNGGRIDYEIIGEGPLLVWNSGGRSGRRSRDYLIAGYIANHGSVLIWDRRNSAGASDVCLSDTPSVVEADVQDLHAILGALGLGPACIGGGSAGCALSLLMAHRYPEDVSSILALNPASRDASVMGPLAEGTWGVLAEAAKSGGMTAVVDLTENAHRKVTSREIGPHHVEGRPAWLARSFESKPGNRQRILDMDPVRFAAMAHKWCDTTAEGGATAGLTDEEIRSLPVPALVIGGNDEVHPPESATWLAQQLADPELHTVPEGTPPSQVQIDWLKAIERFLNRTLYTNK